MALYTDGARGFFDRALLNETIGGTERTFIRTSLRLMVTFADASKREGESAVVGDNHDFVEAVRAAVAGDGADLPAAPKKRRGSVIQSV